MTPEEEGCKKSAKDLPPAAYELAQSFRALDRLMRTSRQIWEKANQRMDEYAAKQMKLYKVRCARTLLRSCRFWFVMQFLCRVRRRL